QRRLSGRAHQRARVATAVARPRVPRPPLDRIFAHRRQQRWTARDRGVRGGPDRRHRDAPAPLPLGGTMTAPPPALPLAHDPAFVEHATVTIGNVSGWFRQRVALSELSCSFGPGVTGLLGPNGAGKTTLMRAITGLVDVNQGVVRIEGSDPRRNREVFR